MLNATTAWFINAITVYFSVTYNSVAIYSTMYSAKNEILLYISSDVGQSGKQKVCNPKVADSNPLCAIIFISIMFSFSQTSSQVNTHNQNDWRVTNQTENTGFIQESYL